MTQVFGIKRQNWVRFAKTSKLNTSRADPQPALPGCAVHYGSSSGIGDVGVVQQDSLFVGVVRGFFSLWSQRKEQTVVLENFCACLT